MKIFELKNLINEQTKSSVESKDIQDYLEKSAGVKKTHSSNLEDNEVALLKSHFIPQTKPAQSPVSKPAGPVGQSSPRPSSEQRPAGAQNQRPATSLMGTGNAGQRPAGQRPDADQRPDAGQRPAGQSTLGNQGGPRPAAQSSQGIQGGPRPIGQGQTGMRQGIDATGRPAGAISTGYVGSQGSYHTGQRPSGEGYAPRQDSGTRPEAGQKPVGTRPEGTVRTDVGQRPVGQQSGMRQGTPGQGYQGGQRQEGQQSGMQQRTDAGQKTDAGQRPAGQSSQGYQGTQRTASQGTSGQGYQRPASQGNYNSNTTDSNRQGGYQGNNPRPAGTGYQGNNQRPAGSGYQGNNPRPAGSGYQGNNPRPEGSGYQGNNPRPAGSGYQGNNPRPEGSGYQGNNPRPAGSGYQGNNPRPAGSGYQGNSPRPAGSGYQGNSPRPAGSGYQGNSPRPAGSGYQGNSPRPAGSGYSQGGTRPAGGGYSQGGARPAGQTGGFSRPSTGTGQRPSGGYSPRGNEGFNKDDDDKPSYNKAGQGAKRGPGGPKPGDRKTFDQQILDKKVAEKNDFNNKRNRDRISKEKTYKDKNLIEREETDNEGNIIKRAPRKGQFIQPKPIIVVVDKDEIKTISLPEILTIKELADKMKMPASTLVKKLFLAGKMVSINQEITFEEAEEIALEYEIIAEKEVKINEVEELLKETEEDEGTMEKRPPVVCVMGHVDHGKTSLLDAIRETNVTSREAGGITQHIGAYVVEINGEKITFLDTPGHEAFTSMRMRGAKSTDIAILVVAADDGVMPQTIEAINHAKAAGVQIIVAINKIDKASANIERVKQELTEYELVAEDWGGDTIFVPVSAHTKEGIDRLLEMILLTAEMIELKANPTRNARGIVIEAELDKGRGPVATILVQKGTLNVGDNIVIGASYGKVRAMMDDKGRRVKEATPSTPVEIIGLNEVPDAGETFIVTDNDKEARTIAEAYISQGREKLIADTKAKLSLDGLFSQIKAGNIKEFNLIIKADVQGSVEAMKQSLLKLSNEEVAVRIIHGGVGAINESDVILASASNAIIIGFNVKPDNAAKETSEREKVEVKLYKVIYNAIDDVEAAMKGLLDPIYEEKIIGHADIRQTFKASGIGTIAGSYVIDGVIKRGSKTRIYRNNTLVYDGILSSLKRFQDDVKEVATGFECGLVFDKFNEVQEGDKVELYVMVEVPR